MAPNDSDVKLKILLAAKKLFARQGFDATSVRQICEEAGVNVALVSYYFGGKENLFLALYEAFFPGRPMSEFEQQLRDPVKGLCLVIEEVMRYLHTDPELYAITMSEISSNSPRAEQLKPFLVPVWQRVKGMLEIGRAQGSFDFKSSDQAVVFIMGALLFRKNTIILQAIMTEGEKPFEEILAETKRFVLLGLGYRGEI